MIFAPRQRPLLILPFLLLLILPGCRQSSQHTAYGGEGAEAQEVLGPWAPEALEAIRYGGQIGLAPPDPRFAQAMLAIPDLFPGLGSDHVLTGPLTFHELEDGRRIWNYPSLSTSGSLAILPEFPAFHHMHNALVGRMAAAIAATPGGLPNRPAPADAPTLAECGYAENGLRALRRLAKIPPPWSPEELRLMARASVAIALETFDPMELLGPWEARAWALCAAAEAANPQIAPLPETILLAESLGYAPEAMELAKSLPMDNVTRWKVLRNTHKILQAAASAKLDTFDRAVMLFATEADWLRKDVVPPAALPSDQEPGAVAALLASRVRSTSGTVLTDALADLFAFEIQALKNPDAVGKAIQRGGLEELLQSGRTGGGLTGRYATAEPKTPSPYTPILPGDLHLLPRRAGAFGSLFLIGTSLKQRNEYAHQFDLVLGSAPLDTVPGLLGRVVRALVLESSTNPMNQEELWNQFEHLLETARLPSLSYEPPDRFSNLPRRLRKIPPSRPRNRHEIRNILLEPAVRQVTQFRDLLRTQATPATADNLSYQLLDALLDNNAERFAEVAHGTPEPSLELTVTLLNILLDHEAVTTSAVATMLPLLAKAPAATPRILSRLSGIYSRIGCDREALNLVLGIPLDNLDPSITQELTERILWQTLLTSGSQAAIQIRPTLPESRSGTSGLIQQILDHLENLPLPYWAYQTATGRLPDARQALTSATIAIAETIRAREDSGRPVLPWLAVIPILSPEFYQDGLEPMLLRLLERQPSRSEELVRILRRRQIVSLADQLEDRGHPLIALKLLQDFQAGTTEPLNLMAARTVRLCLRHGWREEARKIVRLTHARNNLMGIPNTDLLLGILTSDPASLELLAEFDETHPFISALRKLKMLHDQGRVWPVAGRENGLVLADLARERITVGEGVLLLGLSAAYSGNYRRAADAFRAIIWFIQTNPEHPVHMTAYRLLNEVTLPKAVAPKK